MTPIFTVACANAAPANSISIPPAANPRTLRTGDFICFSSLALSILSTTLRIPDHSICARRHRRFFAPQVECLLHRAIGKTEQYRIVRRVMRDLAPRRHDEDVVRAPGEGLVTDDAAPAA